MRRMKVHLLAPLALVSFLAPQALAQDDVLTPERVAELVERQIVRGETAEGLIEA